MNDAIEKAVTAAGSAAALGRVLVPPVTAQAISEWRRQGWMPLPRAVEVEQLYGIERRLLISARLRELIA